PPRASKKPKGYPALAARRLKNPLPFAPLFRLRRACRPLLLFDYFYLAGIYALDVVFKEHDGIVPEFQKISGRGMSRVRRVHMIRTRVSPYQRPANPDPLPVFLYRLEKDLRVPLIDGQGFIARFGKRGRFVFLARNLADHLQALHEFRLAFLNGFFVVS